VKSWLPPLYWNQGRRWLGGQRRKVFSPPFNSWKIGLPGIALVRGAGIIGRALLLDKDRGIEVFNSGIAPFHVGNGHLSGKAGMKRSLSLHLAQLLRLGCVQKIELLDFAVGAVRDVKLIRKQ
jgi:hypothetical protein